MGIDPDASWRSKKNGYTPGARSIRLVTAAGAFLDMCDLTRTTTDPCRAWIGTEAQLKAVRAKFPNTKGMRATRIKF